MHAELSCYLIKKNNFHTQTAWRLKISLGKKPNSHNISDEAEVRQPPNTMFPGWKELEPLYGCTSNPPPHASFLPQTMASKMHHSQQPSSAGLACHWLPVCAAWYVCSLARITLALTWSLGSPSMTEVSILTQPTLALQHECSFAASF